MRSLKLKAPDRRVLMAALILLGLAVFRFALTSEVRYQSETLIQMPWIKNDPTKGVGMARALDGLAYGPRSFTVDGKGQVYLVDSVGRRVLQIDSRGNIIGGIPVPVTGKAELDHIVVTADGRIVVADNSCVSLMVLHGNEWQRIPLIEAPCSGPRRGRVESISPGREGVHVLMLTLDRERLQRQLMRIVFRAEGRRVEVLERMGLRPSGETYGPADGFFPNSLATGRHDRVFIGGWVEEGNGKADPSFSIRVHDGSKMTAQGATTKPVTYKTRLVGVDNKGMMYITMSPGENSGGIRKIDPAGETVWEGSGYWNGSVRAISYVSVTGNGTVYILQPQADSLRILRLKPERNWRLRFANP